MQYLTLCSVNKDMKFTVQIMSKNLSLYQVCVVFTIE